LHSFGKGGEIREGGGAGGKGGEVGRNERREAFFC